jgi:Outer membrane protein beta-barrel domain
MKNLTILLLLLAPSIIFSQKSVYGYSEEYEVDNFFRIGLSAGLNLNKIQGKSFVNEFNYNYGVRGYLQFNFSRKFGVQPELGYNQVTATQSKDYTVIWDEISSGGEHLKVKLNYLNFGTLLNYNLCATRTWLKLQVGPQWGMLLNEKVDSLKTPLDIFKKSDFALVGGILCQWPSVHFGIRYEQGLTNINAIDDRDKWKNQSFQIFVGLTH